MSSFDRGSEWRKWDLHIHTPASFEWSGERFRNMTAERTTETVKAIVDAINASDCAAFCFMDYWTFDGYFKIVEVAKAQGWTIDKTLFPGIELRVTAPVDFRLNIHVLFSENTTPQMLRDFKGSLQILGNTTRPLSDDGLRSFARSLDAGKAKKHGFSEADLEDDDKLLTLGCKTAKITSESLREAKSLVGDERCMVILPYDCSDGIQDLNWQDHCADDAFFLAFADAFESRSEKNIKLFLGIEDEDNADFLAAFLTAIGGRPKPVFSGSDAHRVTDYGSVPSERFTWIKADPTFSGLRQTLVEPAGRTFIGVEPPHLEQVRSNSTKYIKAVTIKRDVGASLDEIWFDSEVRLNPGLVAIIGNKGSGKSALADVIGHLGNTRQHEAFSFLNKQKFRNRKDNKASKFTARIHWQSNLDSSRSLDADFDRASIESVKYIPQSYLEEVCNQQDVQPSTAFEEELEAVIFSHIDPANRLGKATLAELVDFKTKEVERRLTLLREQLSQTIGEIARLEKKQTPEYRQRLTNALADKDLEIKAHAETKPEEVVKPAASDKDAESTLAAQVDGINAAISMLEAESTATQTHLRSLKLKQAEVQRAGQKLDLLEADIARYMTDLDTQLRGLGIDPSTVYGLSVDRSPLTALDTQLEGRIHEAEGILDPENAGCLATRIARATRSRDELQRRLNEPSRRHHAYTKALKDFTQKQSDLIGDDDVPETQRYFAKQLADLETLPAQVTAAETARDAKTREIFATLMEICEIHRKMYAPVQGFAEGEFGGGDFDVSFDVTLSEDAFATGFFDLIARNKAGSFCGVKEGDKRLAQLLSDAQFDDVDSIVQFSKEILHQLRADHRHDNHPKVDLDTQLRDRVPRTTLYEYLFSLTYLRPRYEMKLNGKSLSQLSPGERGTLLLLFYLLVDKDTRPLIIDQPEENLDNQTVYSVLVPAVKAAKRRRQIVLVTHNPNIAVVCDADQVIVAHIDKQDAHRVTYVSGAIEDPQINRALVNILEGTRPAFDNRDAKYQE